MYKYTGSFYSWPKGRNGIYGLSDSHDIIAVINDTIDGLMFLAGYNRKLIEFWI